MTNRERPSRTTIRFMATWVVVSINVKMLHVPRKYIHSEEDTVPDVGNLKEYRTYSSVNKYLYPTSDNTTIPYHLTERQRNHTYYEEKIPSRSRLFLQINTPWSISKEEACTQIISYHDLLRTYVQRNKTETYMVLACLPLTTPTQ